MDPNEESISPGNVAEDVPSIYKAEAFLDYSSPLDFDVTGCDPDVITTSGSTLSNGANFSLSESLDGTPDSRTGKAGFISEINERQNKSFGSDRHLSSHSEKSQSADDSIEENALPMFCPPDVISSSGGIEPTTADRSFMENYSREGATESKKLEFSPFCLDNNDFQPRFIHENSVDETFHKVIARNSKEFFGELNQTRLTHLKTEGDSETNDSKTNEPFESAMQNDKRFRSHFANGRFITDSADTNKSDFKSEDRGPDYPVAEAGDADSLASVTFPELCSVAKGFPLKETDAKPGFLSFSMVTSVDGDKFTQDLDFPDGSNSAISSSKETNDATTLLELSINNVDCIAIDDCKRKEPCKFGLETGFLSSCNDEREETFEKFGGQDPVRSRCAVTHDFGNADDDLFATVSDRRRDEGVSCLFFGEVTSSAVSRLSGSCSSNNSSRSGSLSSAAGKNYHDASDEDSAAKVDSSNKNTTADSSNGTENNCLDSSFAHSDSDSLQSIPTTSSRTLPLSSLQSPPTCLSPSSSFEVPQNIILGPPLSSNINLPITRLGRVAPTWLPDGEALRCMQCDATFSFTRRRHHCRACGKIFCGSCSNSRFALQYLKNKESRVCSKCYQDLIRAQYYQKIHRKSQVRPNPNNPSEYCSDISPLLQVQSLNPAPLPSVMVPTGGVLRKQGSFRCKSEAKQVIFSDGIRPGGDLTEVAGITSQQSTSVSIVRQTRRVEKPGGQPGQNASGSSDLSLAGKSVIVSKQNTCLIPPFGELPPVVVNLSSNKGYSLIDSPTMEFVLHHLRSADHPVPVTFVIDKYLAVIVKIVNLDCCVNRLCWSFSTKGMRSVGQDEIVILLECFPGERTLPSDVFHHLHSIYRQAGQGSPVNSLDHSILPPGCFGGADHGGFLFIRRTFQCLEKLVLPEPPYLFGILLQKWEIAWAKVFPLRLLLRLGAEFRYYPCPLVGVRDRRPVYGEIGHTIMNLLADFHSFRYMVPHISGLVIHLEVKRTTVKIPCSRYDMVMKVLNGTNGHVLALGADFSSLADSHLVCVQNDDGNYQTQTIDLQRKTCKVTGASFVVFNGALKPSPVTLAKSSIVEDGVMIQVTPSMMSDIKQSWKDMKNYTITCSNLSNDDSVTVEWVDDGDSTATNSDMKSPVDGMSLGGKETRRIHNATDFAYDDHVIRWTEIFLLCNETSESTNVDRLVDQIAQVACTALVPHSPLLTDALMTKIGLRVTIGSAQVGFKAGSNKRPLPDPCTSALEEKLLPLLQKHSPSSPLSSPLSSPMSSPSATDHQGTLVVELVFYILHPSSTIASTCAVDLPD